MRLLQALSAAILAAAALVAQPAQQAPCATPEHRAFDFWVGEWQVFTPAGALAGTNRIEKIVNGCALLENWEDSQGKAGKSWNFFDTRTKQWKQFWMDGSGLGQHYSGGSFEQGMRFLDEQELPKGGRLIRRMTFTKLAGGEVEQLIEVSKDGGETFAVGFKGTYKRKK